MSPLAILSLSASMASAIAMHWFDSRMQRFRSPDAPAAAFRWVPLRWMNAGLYTDEGQQYRAWAIRSWWLCVFFFACAILAIFVNI